MFIYLRFVEKSHGTSAAFQPLAARLGVLGYYRLNKSYIAANLCENRTKKDSTCAGKCYLRKQLKKVDDTEYPAKHNTFKKESEELPLFFARTDFSTAAFVHTGAVTRRTPALQHLRDTHTMRDVFHPPSFVA